MSGIKAIIFDLDGTLLDSMNVWKNVDEAFFKKRGIEVPDDYNSECAKRSFYETAEYTKQRFSLSETPEQLVEEWTEMAIEEYRSKVELKKNAVYILDEARKRGYKTAVCTSLMPELYTPALERCGLSDKFDAIVSASVYGSGKQFPNVYLHTAELLGVSADECIMIDDVAQSLIGARSAGMKTIGVYEKNSNQSASEMKENSDLYLISLSDEIFTL